MKFKKEHLDEQLHRVVKLYLKKHKYSPESFLDVADSLFQVVETMKKDAALMSSNDEKKH